MWNILDDKNGIKSCELVTMKIFMLQHSSHLNVCTTSQINSHYITERPGFETLGHFFEVWIVVRIFGQWGGRSSPPMYLTCSVRRREKEDYISWLIQSYSCIYPVNFTGFKQEGVEPIKLIVEGARFLKSREIIFSEQDAS